MIDEGSVWKAVIMCVLQSQGHYITTATNAMV